MKNELQAQTAEQIVQVQITLNLIWPTKSAQSLSHQDVHKFWKSVEISHFAPAPQILFLSSHPLRWGTLLLHPGWPLQRSAFDECAGIFYFWHPIPKTVLPSPKNRDVSVRKIMAQSWSEGHVLKESQPAFLPKVGRQWRCRRNLFQNTVI